VLNLPEESDDAKTTSEKTLYTMRQAMIDHQLDEVTFDALAKNWPSCSASTPKTRVSI
jgi:hypothetical protein